MSVFSMIKNGIEFVVNIPLFLQIRMKSEKPRTWLFLSPQYLNYGDHLIALSELEYMTSIAKTKPIDVNYSFFEIWGNTVVPRIKNSDILWITGGGYLGDLWPQSHEAAEKVLELFPNNTIVFAPQTTYYSDIHSPNARRFAEIVKQHGKCVFFSREQNTVDQLQALGIESKLLPDFGLLTDYCTKPDASSAYISFCFRRDLESALQENSIAALKDDLKQYGLPFHDITMARRHYEIPTWSRRFFINRKFREYARSSFVVTDRLHAMIFCCVAGVPCVALDNQSKKISGVYQWVKELEYISFVSSLDDVKDAVAKVTAHQNKEKNRAAFILLKSRLVNDAHLYFDQYII